MNRAIEAVDIFCGVGGLTVGLEKAGINVRMCVDLDPKCRYPIDNNSSAEFLEADVSTLDSRVISRVFKTSKVTLLAGCAPCQPFSTYSRSTKKNTKSIGGKVLNDWKLVEHFGRLVEETGPDLVTMENVPPLAQQGVFEIFLHQLKEYWIDWRVVECISIGLPQSRKRLVLVASKLGPISIPDYKLEPTTVRETIGHLPKLSAGETDLNDPLHRSSKLSTINLKRIRSSVPGGTWRDWPHSLRAQCHKKESGVTYPSVYGRMIWDAPSPTITTQSFGYGNGRFGHPEQDRAISIREAAMLQGFPQDYSFVQDGDKVCFSTLGRLIGNAVPVGLGHIIGRVFMDHVGDL